MDSKAQALLLIHHQVLHLQGVQVLHLLQEVHQAEVVGLVLHLQEVQVHQAEAKNVNK